MPARIRQPLQPRRDGLFGHGQSVGHDVSPRRCCECAIIFRSRATSSSPASGAGRHSSPFSRRDFCSRASSPSHHVANGFPACAISWVSLCPTQAANKGEAERPETRRHNPRLAGTGRPLRGRSPLGVPLRLLPGGQLVPKALHQAMLRETVRSARSYGPPTGARIVRISTGVTRAGKTIETSCPRTVSTSRAGHDADRLMPDAARERVTNPPAGTALAPSQGVSSRRTSLRKARWSLLVRRALRIQEIPAAGAIPLI